MQRAEGLPGAARRHLGLVVLASLAGVGLVAAGCGSDGGNGAPGVAGVVGNTGPVGPAGPTGTSGASGPAGPAGPSGPTGAQGTQGTQGPPGSTGTLAPIDTRMSKFAPLPGLQVTVLSVTGSGAGGKAMRGDAPSVTFSVATNAGRNVPLSELDFGEILISGPTENYHRVIPLQSDLLTRAVDTSPAQDKTRWTYTFAPGLAMLDYLPAFNESPDLPTNIGKMSGQPVRDGTYTVGIHVAKLYSVDGSPHRVNRGSPPTPTFTEVYRDRGSATFDFLLGATASSIQKREVVTNANCTQCHVNLKAHGQPALDFTSDGEKFLNVTYCLLCHTTGAEDLPAPPGSTETTASSPSPTGISTTPGNSIDFRVMMHRLHNGDHLPTVNGWRHNATGDPVYDPASAKPYAVNGLDPTTGAVTSFDFSHVHYTRMPNLTIAVAKRIGYTNTGAGNLMGVAPPGGFSPAQLAEDRILLGVTDCNSCHGAPVGNQGLPAPAQGDLAYVASFMACAACHDDFKMDQPFRYNTQTGCPQPFSGGGFTSCVTCHFTGAQVPATSGGVVTRSLPNPGPAIGAGWLDPRQAHVHQLDDVGGVNSGIVLTLLSLDNGTPGVPPSRLGDRIRVNFTMGDGAGFAIHPSTAGAANFGQINRLNVGLSGPTQNPNILIPDVIIPFFQVLAQTPAPPPGTLTANYPYSAFLVENVAFKTMGPADGVPRQFNPGKRFYFFNPPVAVPAGLVNAVPQVLEAAPAGNNDTLSVATVRSQTFIKVSNMAQWSFADEFKAGQPTTGFVVIEYDDTTSPNSPGVREEFARIQYYDAANDRIWLTAPLQHAHPAGASIRSASVTVRPAVAAPGPGTCVITDFNTPQGQVNWSFGAPQAPGSGRRAVISYTTDFTIPSLYPPPFKAPTPDDEGTLGEYTGNWAGKPLVNGTYYVAVYTNRTWTIRRQPNGVVPWAAPANGGREDTTFNGGSPTYNPLPFVLTDGVPDPRTNLSSAQPRLPVIDAPNKCHKCHGQLVLHGGARRDFQMCITCHGTAGKRGENPAGGHLLPNGNPRGAGVSQPLNSGASTNFRVMLHKIHMGKDLFDPSVFINGFNLLKFTIDDNVFPANPGRARNCTMCHEPSDETWQELRERDHPADFASPKVRNWTFTCTSCHDDPGAANHTSTQVVPNPPASPVTTKTTGAEACVICHGPTGIEPVKVVHVLNAR